MCKGCLDQLFEGRGPEEELPCPGNEDSIKVGLFGIFFHRLIQTLVNNFREYIFDNRAYLVFLDFQGQLSSLQVLIL